jgi:transcriptional regulator with XRE-family HTH domain
MELLSVLTIEVMSKLPYLKRVRQAQGLSQTELGVRASVNPNYISQYEHGLEVRSIGHLEQLARALGVSPQALTGIEAAREA